MTDSYRPLHEIFETADFPETSDNKYKCVINRMRKLLLIPEVSCGSSDCAECVCNVIKIIGKKIENEYALLPVDEKGKPWHIGDRCVIKASGRRASVSAIEYTKSNPIMLLNVIGDCDMVPYHSEEIDRPRRDSIDQVIEDLQGMYYDRVADPDEFRDIADRLIYLKDVGYFG